MSYRDELHGTSDIHLNSGNSISMSYGAVRGSSHNLSDARFDPIKTTQPNAALQQIQSAATKQAIANAKQQTLLAQKLKQQMTNFASWATNAPSNSVDQNYGSFHSSQWPAESTDYSNIYGLNNILLPGNQSSNTATSNAISNMLQPQTASLMNPTLAMVNPLINSLVNPLINPFAVSALGTFGTGVPDGKQHALFVFHLPEDIDDHGLLQLFAPYGATRANVMRHDTGRSRGFGFVHFTNRQEASIAIEMMNGHQIGRKRLRVSMKKDKPEGSLQNNLQQNQDKLSSSPQQ